MVKVVKLLVLLTLCCIAELSHAQKNLLQRRVSLHLNQCHIPQALKQLADSAGFLLSYDANQISAVKKVSGEFKNERVLIILNRILGKGFNYTVASNHLIIRKNREIIVPDREVSNPLVQTDDGVINGLVLNQAGEKIKGAKVYEVGELNMVTTDQNGQFVLPSKRSWAGIFISSKGYRDTLVEVVKSSSQLIVILKDGYQFDDSLRARPATIESKINLPTLLVPSSIQIKSISLPLYERRAMQVSLLPAIGSNHRFSGLVSNNFSINVIGGYAMAVEGLEMAGAFNLIREDVKGVQLAGFANLTGRNVSGVQLAGFTNSNRGKAKGIFIAGFSNVNLDTLKGVQLSGFTNVSGRSSRGMQIAGFSNISGDNAKGMQLAGFSNITNGDVKGFQFAGFLNFNRKQSSNLQLAGFMNLGNQVNGVQISGFSNVVYRDIHGMQFAGMFNYAKRVKGFQLGLINICDTISGVQLGLFNIVRKGYHSIEYRMNEQQAYMLNIKTGTHRFYNIISAGQFQWNNFNDLSFGYGLGTQQKLSKRFSIEIDVIGNLVYNTISRTAPEYLWVFSAIHFVYKPFRILHFFAGPSGNMLVERAPGVQPLDANKGLRTLPSATLANLPFQAWIGYSLGVRFF